MFGDRGASEDSSIIDRKRRALTNVRLKHPLFFMMEKIIMFDNLERAISWMDENSRHIRFHPRIMGFLMFFVRLIDISEGKSYSFDDMRIIDGELVWEWVFDDDKEPVYHSDMTSIVKGLFFTLCLNENELSEICDTWKYKCKNKNWIFSKSEREELNSLFAFIPPIDEIICLNIRAIGDKRFVWHSDTKPSARNTVTLYELSKRNDEELHNPIFVNFVNGIVEVES